MDIKTKVRNIVKREKYQKRDKIGISSILWVTVLTAVNIILYACNASFVFVFSAYVPFLFGAIGVNIVHSYVYYISAISPEPLTHEFAWMCIAVAIICVVAYLMCWIFGKKHFGWRIAALVFVCIDAVIVILVLIRGDLSFIIDVIFHAVILFEMIAGISAHGKLKTIPEEELPEETQDVSESEQ